METSEDPLLSLSQHSPYYPEMNHWVYGKDLNGKIICYLIVVLIVDIVVMLSYFQL